MTTFPSGAALPASAQALLDGTDPILRISSADGYSKFDILGPLMPWAGIQAGVICTDWPHGMSPPFKHLDLQGARQDGVTWTDTVYDPPDIILPCEAHGNTPQEISQAVSEWISTWDPKNPPTMEYITLDRGYWYCKARLTKPIATDEIKLSPRRLLKQKLTTACRIDNAFWSSIPSTDSFSGLSNEVQKVTNTGGGTGGYWQASKGGVLSSNIPWNATSAQVQTALEGLYGTGNVIVTGVDGGPWTITFQGDLAQQAVAKMGVLVFITGTFTPSMTVDELTKGGEGSGFISLTNIGSEPAPPAYLCYGPGVFSFANGPGSTSMITLGTVGDSTKTLLDGQIVLVTTDPRLRAVVDLSPTVVQTTDPTQLNFFQTLLKDLVSFVSNNNTPPLLSWFESLFGILPPQANLYSLLNGRFTNPVPGVPQPKQAAVSHIPVAISGGNANSKIIASITPMRRWPE